jgi:hypothetical protein
MKNRTEKTNKLLYTCRVRIPVRSDDPTIARCATAAAYAHQLSMANAHVSRDTPPSRALHSYTAIFKPLETQGGITAMGEMLTVCVRLCVKGNVFLTQTASLATNQVFR